MRENASSVPIAPERMPLFERVSGTMGLHVFNFAHGVVRFIGFLGEMLIAAGRIALHARQQITHSESELRVQRQRRLD